MKKLICYCLLLLPFTGYSQFYEEEEVFVNDKVIYDDRPIPKGEFNCVVLYAVIGMPEVHIDRYIRPTDKELVESLYGVENVQTFKYYIKLEIGKAFDTDKVLKTVTYELGCKTIKND
jgi:hypothetical protein